MFNKIRNNDTHDYNITIVDKECYTNIELLEYQDYGVL